MKTYELHNVKKYGQKHPKKTQDESPESEKSNNFLTLQPLQSLDFTPPGRNSWSGHLVGRDPTAWLFREFVGDKILPSYVGITINHKPF